MVFKKNNKGGKKLPASDDAKDTAKQPKRLKLPNFLKNKKLWIIAGAVAIVAIVIVAVVWFLNGQNSPARAVEQIGEKYYTEQFYTQVESLGDKKTDFLKKSHDTGIFVSLENLQRFAKRTQDEKYQNKLQKITEKCDVNKTKVKITPNDPFGKQDFTAEAILEGCE